jgi:hypothetical protein
MAGVRFINMETEIIIVDNQEFIEILLRYNGVSN